MYIDILYVIAEHIEPNPELFYRLATVSREFYLVFSSDTVWKRLNPYGVSENIKNSFWEACNKDPKEAKIAAMQYRYPTCPPIYPHPTDLNLFSWIGALLQTHNVRYLPHFESNIPFMRCLFAIRGIKMADATRATRENTQLARIALQQSPCVLAMLPYSIRANRELVMVCLKAYAPGCDCVPPLRAVSVELCDDEEIVSLACGTKPSSLLRASPRLRGDREFVRSIVASNGKALLYSNFLEDRDLSLLAVKTSWEVFVLSGNFRDDDEIVLAAVSHPRSLALAVASPRLQRDRRLVLAAARAGACFESLHPELKDDKEIALALTDWDSCLDLFSARIQNDVDVVRKAVAISGFELARTSDAIRDNFDIVMIAVANEGASIVHASTRLQNNFEIALTAIKSNPAAYTFISPQLKEMEFGLAYWAICLDGSVLRFLPTHWRLSRDIVKKALSSSGGGLRYLCRAYRSDPELVAIAVAQNGKAIRYAARFLYSDPKIIAIAASQKPTLLFVAPPQIRGNQGVLRAIAAAQPLVIKYITRIRCDAELALVAIASDYRAYAQICTALKDSLEFAIKAVQVNGACYCILSNAFRKNPDVKNNINIWSMLPREL